MYTPQIKDKQIIALKRAAWLNRKPMTVIVADIVDKYLSSVNPDDACSACKDKTCALCFFNKKEL